MVRYGREWEREREREETRILYLMNTDETCDDMDTFFRMIKIQVPMSRAWCGRGMWAKGMEEAGHLIHFLHNTTGGGLY